jgi:2-phospho-L-lactate/phosphoenolpyruvate guanylyltransferase
VNAGPIWAVVPVKPFKIAKQRLTPILTWDERAQLAQLMFEDVLDVLVDCAELSGVMVVTRDHTAQGIARAQGAMVLGDPALDINTAVRAAIEVLSERHSAGMLVVPSDIPLLPSALIGEMVDRFSRLPTVALVPAARDEGTNLLACSPVNAVEPSFGPNSFQRHYRAARSAGIVPTVLPCERAGLDIDRAQDLAAFLSVQSETRSHAFLATKDVGARLQHNGGYRDAPRQTVNA